MGCGYPEKELLNPRVFLVQCPTTIVPFFGDQPFWGDRVYAKGVGPPPIPVDEFSLDKLVHAIHYMMNPQVFLTLVSLLCHAL